MKRPDPHYRLEELAWLHGKTRDSYVQAQHVAPVLRGYLVCLGRSTRPAQRRMEASEVLDIIFRVTCGWWKAMKDCEDKEFAEEAWYFYSYKPARAIRPLLKELLPPEPENFAEPPGGGTTAGRNRKRERRHRSWCRLSLLFCVSRGFLRSRTGQQA